MSRLFNIPPQSQVLTESGRMRGEWYRYFEDMHSWSGHRGSAYPIWDLDVGGIGAWDVGTTGTYSPQAGINLRAFDAATNEYIERASGLRNGYTSGTDIYPAILWVPTDATAGSVKWQVETSGIGKDGSIPALAAASVVTASPGVKDQATMSLLDPVAGNAFRAGDAMIQVVSRLATDPADTYAADAAILWAGFAYQCSGLGTRERTP